VRVCGAGVCGVRVCVCGAGVCGVRVCVCVCGCKCVCVCGCKCVCLCVYHLTDTKQFTIQTNNCTTHIHIYIHIYTQTICYIPSYSHPTFTQ
jgi:hypothetical protein